MMNPDNFLLTFMLSLFRKNMTTLESITHSYPTSLLSSLPSNHNTSLSSAPATAPNLSYKQRQSLSRRAQEINVYDLGWRRNLKQVFFGGHNRHRDRGLDLGDGGRCEDEDKRVTIGMVLGAMWPTKIGYDQYVHFPPFPFLLSLSLSSLHLLKPELT